MVEMPNRVPVVFKSPSDLEGWTLVNFVGEREHPFLFSVRVGATSLPFQWQLVRPLVYAVRPVGRDEDAIRTCQNVVNYATANTLAREVLYFEGYLVQVHDYAWNYDATGARSLNRERRADEWIGDQIPPYGTTGWTFEEDQARRRKAGTTPGDHSA